MKPFLEKYRSQLFIAVVVLQALVLLGMVVKRQQLLDSPNTVLLQCEPVDPRSLLSGDYVILTYSISRFDGEKMRRLNLFHESYTYGETVYVALQPGQKIPTTENPESETAPHQAVAISRDLKKLRETYPLILRGRTTSDHQWPGSTEEVFDEFSSGLSLEYGVEEYFVPQYEGRRIETELAKTTVEVALADSGESAIRRLFLDGEEVRFY